MMKYIKIMKIDPSMDRDGSILDYCRLNDITINPIVGTTDPGRLKDICRASDIALTRLEWYEIYQAAGNNVP